jgi:hypothetical protein
MNSLQVMAARFNQDAFWDPNLYPVPQTASLEYPGNYRMTHFRISHLHEGDIAQHRSVDECDPSLEHSVGRVGEEN